MGEQKPGYNGIGDINELYAHVIEQYQKFKEDLSEGKTETASSDLFGIIYVLDALKFQETDPEKSQNIRKLIEDFEGLQKAVDKRQKNILAIQRKIDGKLEKAA